MIKKFSLKNFILLFVFFVSTMIFAKTWNIDLTGESSKIYSSKTVNKASKTESLLFSNKKVKKSGFKSVSQKDASLELYSGKFKTKKTIKSTVGKLVNFKVNKGINSKVSINGQNLATDESGNATFTIKTAGTYKYTVTADGYISKTADVTISNANVNIAVSLDNVLRDTKSDTWVAVDELGRSVVTNLDTGDRRTNKVVGLFYYIWHQETAGWDIHDISKILKNEEPWGGAPSFHHYAKSLYDYYSSKDEFVIRKHMQMFADAGVDFLFLDNTNANIYSDVQKTILETLLKMKSEGYKVPKISWTCYNGDVNTEVESLYDFIQSNNGKYNDLLFNWQGKPLLLGFYTGTRVEVANYFTIKKSWAWTNQPWFTETQGKNRWPWLDNYPQKPGLDGNGNIEQITVTAAQHPHGVYAIGKSTVNPISAEPVYGNDGKYFNLQWSRALEVDPPMIMVTQWNEWIAQRFIYQDPKWNQPVTHMVRKPLKAGDPIFIDCWSPEYSRDLEPLRTEYRDNMYLQFVSNIRKYKGTRSLEKASGNKTITLNNDFTQWNSVGPVFLDDIGDTAHRNHKSFGSDFTYTNTTGRNDIDEMRVSYDADNVYFYVKTVDNLTSHTNAKWMNLLINTDNESTGWNGYDFIVNNVVNSSTSTTLKSYSGTDFVWNSVANINYVYSGNQMHIKIPKSLLKISAKGDFKIDFKWVDNSITTGDIIDVYVDGDAAPNSRFNYRYQAKTTTSPEDICLPVASPAEAMWDFKTSIEGWSAQNNLTSSASSGNMNLSITGNDPNIISSFINKNASLFPYIKIRLKNSTAGNVAVLYFTTKNETALSESKKVTFPITTNDQDYKEYVVDMSLNAKWTGIINQIRFDPSETYKAGVVSVDYIMLAPLNLHNYNKKCDFEKWSNGINLSKTFDGDVMVMSLIGTDPSIMSPPDLTIDAKKDNLIFVKMKNTTASKSGSIYFRTLTDQVWSESKRINFVISANDTEFKVYTIDMGTNVLYKGRITDLRFDPVNDSSSGNVYVEQILVGNATNTLSVIDYASNIQNNLNNIYLHPNPVSDILKIEGVEKDMQFKIYNILGQLVATGTGNQINVSALKSGVYILVSKDNLKAKFIKK